MKSRTLIGLALASIALAPADAHAIPAWARRYNMNCSGCHSPAVPRLNLKGFLFKWAGYRMPEEIGEKQEVKQIADYVAFRATVQYLIAKNETESVDVNTFALDNATVFAGGALGKNYGGMLEFNHKPGGVDLMVNLVGVWGKETQFVGLRGGQMHWLYEGGVAGFDRPTGIIGPTPLEGPNTSGNPFQFASDGVGMEAFYVSGQNRLSFEILNSVSPAGGMGAGINPTSKDFVAIDQFIYDNRGSGLTAAGFYGSIDGLDTAVAKARTSHYTRLALTANKIFKHVEVLGGYVYSKDADLPIGRTFTKSDMTGSGYWVYGGYTFPSALTVFSRYEFVNPNTDATKAASTRLALGGVLPVNLPEYLRLAAEYTLDTPQATAGLKRHGFVLELMFAF